MLCSVWPSLEIALIFLIFRVFFFLFLIVNGGVQLGPLRTSATNWPLVLAPGDYEDKEFGGMMIGRGNRILGENLPQCHFVHHKPHMTSRGANSGHRGGKPATNRLSYGTAIFLVYKVSAVFMW
jgi:hypothetical protein